MHTSMTHQSERKSLSRDGVSVYECERERLERENEREMGTQT